MLALLLDGLSYKIIAGKLDIIYDTVGAHMKKIYEKINVASATEALAKVINKCCFRRIESFQITVLYYLLPHLVIITALERWLLCAGVRNNLIE